MSNLLRERVLLAAVEMVSDDGFEAMTMRKLAKKAGCSITAIYSVFPSKEDILAAIEDRLYSSFVVLRHQPEQVRAMLEVSSAEEVLRQFVASFGEVSHGLRMQYFRLMNAQCVYNERIRQIAYGFFIAEPQNSMEILLSVILEHGGIPETDVKVLSMLWGRSFLMYGYLGTLFYMDRENADYFDMVEFFFQCTLRGVKPAEEVSVSFSVPSTEYEPWEAVSPDSTKNQILGAAFRLLDEYGSKRVTTRMISEAVGISTGTLPSHFVSKEDIFQEIYTRLFIDNDSYLLDGDALLAAFRAGEPDGIATCLARYNSRLDNNMSRISLSIIFREQYNSDYVRDQFWGMVDSNIAILTQVLDTLAQEGTIPACDGRKLATIYVYTMTAINFNSVIYPQEMETLDETRQAAGKWILGLMLYGLQS